LAAELFDVSELFFSIQGESSFAGYPCVFIRLSGCNLRCNYCDASYTYEEPSNKTALNEIIQFVNNYPNAIVEITGGEPLLQENSLPLMQNLLDLGRTVLLETNGSLTIETIPDQVIKIMDLKCPDSGMHKEMLLDNLVKLTGRDEIKCVVSSRADYDWAVNTLRKKGLLDHPLQESSPPKAKILFSPVTGKLDAPLLAEWILQDNLPVRLQLQLHKIIWPNQDRGV
jgi:7-carboxy-7-deazaguanine synthase